MNHELQELHLAMHCMYYEVQVSWITCNHMNVHCSLCVQSTLMRCQWKWRIYGLQVSGISGISAISAISAISSETA